MPWFARLCAVAICFTLGCGASRPSYLEADLPLSEIHQRVDIRAIDDDGLEPVTHKLQAVLAQSNAPDEIVLHIDSPGGEVGAMFRFASLMREVELGGTNVVCVVDGWAASAAFYLLQNCTTRVMTDRSALMAHEPLYGGNSGGTGTDIQRSLDELHELAHILAIAESSRLHITLA